MVAIAVAAMTIAINTAAVGQSMVFLRVVISAAPRSPLDTGDVIRAESVLGRVVGPMA